MFAVGDTFFLAYKARRGRLESITIKCINGSLITDTFNALYNSYELCSEAEALALIEQYEQYMQEEEEEYGPQPDGCGDTQPTPYDSYDGGYTDYRFEVGDTVYLAYKARWGKLETITIKCIEDMGNEGYLITDTLNALYNGDELCDEDTANYLVQCFNQYWDWLLEHFPVMPVLPVRPWNVYFKYDIGSTVWATTKSGRKEAVVIKELIYNKYHEGIPQPYRPLYLDTFNWLWNEGELSPIPPGEPAPGGP
jgi:hypothetical protein